MTKLMLAHPKKNFFLNIQLFLLSCKFLINVLSYSDVHKILWFSDSKFLIMKISLKISIPEVNNTFVSYYRSDVYHFSYGLYYCVAVGIPCLFTYHSESFDPRLHTAF